MKKINYKDHKKKKVTEEFKKEFLFNVPTFLNTLRILLTFIVVYLIISDRDIILIVCVFILAAITDFFDGKIARAYNLVNPFGAKADMLADRILWVSTALSMFIVFGLRGYLNYIHAIQIGFLMSREIIAAPSAISYLLFGEKIFPNARYIAKLTTFLQGFAFPFLMLSIFYPFWSYFSVPLSAIVLVTGIFSGLFYIRDLGKLNTAK